MMAPINISAKAAHATLGVAMRQRPMQQLQPGVRAPVTTHLEQPQQQPGERMHRRDHHVDLAGLLREIHHAGEEHQHQQLRERIHHGPGKEAPELGFEDVRHRNGLGSGGDWSRMVFCKEAVDRAVQADGHAVDRTRAGGTQELGETFVLVEHQVVVQPIDAL